MCSKPFGGFENFYSYKNAYLENTFYQYGLKFDEFLNVINDALSPTFNSINICKVSHITFN